MEETEEIEVETEEQAPLTDQFSEPLEKLGNEVKKILSDDLITEYMIDKSKITVEPNGKISAIINTDGENAFTPQKRIYVLTFEEPTFISSIKFFLENKNLGGTNVKYTFFDNTTKEITIDKNNTELMPDALLKRIELNLEKIEKRPKINTIKLHGFDKSSYEVINKYVNRYYEMELELEELHDKIKTFHQGKMQENSKLIAGMEGLRKSIAQKTKEHEELETSLQDLLKELHETREENKQLKEKSTSLLNEITENTNTNNDLQEKIKTQNKELNEITENKALIAQEVEAYIKQSNKDILAYIILALTPTIVIAGIFYSLFFGTYKLSTVFNKDPQLNYAIATYIDQNKDNNLAQKADKNITIASAVAEQKEIKSIDIGAVFWSRVPFMLIVISILVICFKIAFLFANKIMELHHQRRIFTKIFILAKEVSDKSVEGEGLTVEEKINFRTKLKMNILREHLKDTINLDYNHKLEPTLWEKIIATGMKKIEDKLNPEDKKDIQNVAAEISQRKINKKSKDHEEEEESS